jgi:acetolactate synthase I/II/III large subunit
MSTGADRICAALGALGIETVFGLPGTQNVPLFEALRTSRLRTILATNELGAAFMAAGHYRASGRVAALFTIPGPGFTYALTGLAEARHDSSALLHITGAPPPEGGRSFQLQALDQTAMAAPVVKRHFRIDREQEIEPVLREAFVAATSGEPGPVLVEVRPDVFTSPSLDASPIRPLPQFLAPDAAATILARLRTARRPLLFVGQGAVAGAYALRRLAEWLNAPVVTTLSGRGVLPEDHPLAVGIDLGGPGLTSVNDLIATADLVLALGCKFSHNGTGGFRLRLPPDKLVHVDASAEVLGVNYPASLLMQADVPALLESLVTSLPGAAPSAATWVPSELAAARTDAARQVREGGSEPRIRDADVTTPAELFRALRAAVPRDAILVTDSGLHQSLARRHFTVLAPRGLMCPSDFQSMGFGIPAAVGAAIGAPQRRVVALVGDGGFAMAGLELLAAVRERLPVAVIVFNDGQLGLIREQQLREYGHAHAVSLDGFDIAAVAAAAGAQHVRLEGRAEEVLRDALARDWPVVVEVMIGDSAGQHAAHAKGYVKQAVRGLLGDRLRGWLKGLR